MLSAFTDEPLHPMLIDPCPRSASALCPSLPAWFQTPPDNYRVSTFLEQRVSWQPRSSFACRTPAIFTQPTLFALAAPGPAASHVSLTSSRQFFPSFSNFLRQAFSIAPENRRYQFEHFATSHDSILIDLRSPPLLHRSDLNCA
jgi:hypothetical protein